MGSERVVRETAHVGASQTAREVEAWLAAKTSPDSATLEEIPILRDRARDLDRNNGLARNIRITKRDSVVGERLNLSPRPNWRALGKSPEWAADWSKQVRGVWQTWADTTAVDAERRMTFGAMLGMVYDARFLSGSACVVPYWLDRSWTPFRTALKVVEADRLSTPGDRISDANLRDGIEFDINGAPIAYWLENGHPDEDVVNRDYRFPEWERIEAFYPWGRPRFLHIYESSRPGQSKGVAAASAVMAEFGLAGKYRLTELQATIASSRIAGVLETPLSDEQAAEMMGVDMKTVGEIRRKWRGELTPGSILNIPPGTKFTGFNPGRPATAYAAFMENLSREISAAFGLPFELGTRNFSKTNYSSARAALNEAWRGFRVERARIAEQFCDPVYSMFLEDAIDLGMIEAEGFYENRPAWCCAEWIGRSEIPIDPLKDANAKAKMLETGQMTLTRIYESEGRDMETELETMHRERQLDRELAERFGNSPLLGAVSPWAAKEDQEDDEDAENKSDDEAKSDDEDAVDE